MNQKIWSSLTATLLIATLGTTPSYANQTGSANEGSDRSAASTTSPSDPGASTSVSNHSTPTNTTLTNSTSARPNTASARTTGTSAQTGEAVKVGEYQSQEDTQAEASIATIHPHEMAGRQAATLYVRNIPVLTFLGTSRSAAQPANNSNAQANSNAAQVKVASVQLDSAKGAKAGAAAAQSAEDKSIARSMEGLNQGDSQADDATAANPENPRDPVWRATTIAARLNQLHHNNVDASTITVAWDNQRQDYLIKAGKDVLVEMVPNNTIFPNTTEDAAEDALQATNLIRRQLGYAPPLSSVQGGPHSGDTQVSLGPVQFTIKGMASWYGPGLDGNYSASGEVFNQDALTAAHRNLPFGTQVRVTNMDNGLSVVVRINDRGPFSADRVIDLSSGAARVIGLTQSGVAPVSLEVLGATRTAANQRQN